MGREWYWGGGKSSKRSGREKDNGVSTASGCMCAVFQLFDFHQFHFSTLPQQQKPSIVSTNSNLLPDEDEDEDPPVPKGVEAPRNSFELEESQKTSSLMSSPSEDENLNIPMGIQIKTNRDSTTRSKAHGATTYAPSDCSSEISSSPGTKTPNLVARLMGLDLLPENNNLSSPTSTLNTPNLPHGKSYLHHFRHKHHLHQTNKPIPHRNSVDGGFTGTRSLPETPRISSARRSDVDLHHRLSLQINKENMTPAEELVLSRISSLGRLKEVRSSEDNESRSPSHYARQIVKQVKESVVGRKVGWDITNTVRNRAENESKEELLSRYKSKKLSKMASTNNAAAVDDLSGRGKQPTSCSPRLKFPEMKKENYNINNDVVSHPPKASLSSISSHASNVSQNDKLGPNKPKLSPLQVQRQQQQDQKKQRPVKKCKKAKEEKFGTVPPPRLIKKPPQTSDIIRNKQEEPFVRPTLTPNIPDKKCKKTPLSNDLLNNITSVPTLLPVKKDPTPPATKILQKQVPTSSQESKRGCSQLSSCSSQSYNQEATRTSDARGITNNNANINNKNDELNGGCSGGAAAMAEYEYVTRILRRTGIDNDTPVSFTRWFSPSHPLDPSIFHYLENCLRLSQQRYASGQLSHNCNRKLLFHLVDEILVEILKPYINLKPWSRQHFLGQGGEMFKGSHLVSTLCSRIKSYPRADCRVLEDIDGIIDKDLPLMKFQSEAAFEEEAEWIVTEIEKDILDTLVHETALVTC